MLIPSKRDKFGKRLGSVRFVAIGERSALLEKLNKVCVDSFIIKAFIPRFARMSRSNLG